MPKNRTIHFKSSFIFFMKEWFGKKTNTVRFTDDWSDERWEEFEAATHISISLAGIDYHVQFTREIKDKSIYKNLAIISW